MISGITGAHWIIFSPDADADRTFLRDVLELDSVDAGGGWLIFRAPASELAVHPGGPDVAQQSEQGLTGAVLYLMCDDLESMIASLAARGVQCTDVEDAGWGRHSSFNLPGGGGVGLYQPAHPVAI